MKIYIASSWKNVHAVEMLTALLRKEGHDVLSFVENSHNENIGYDGKASFDEWIKGTGGRASFDYDIEGATSADTVVYIGPSGPDAWAEVGAAYASGWPRIMGLWAKGEPIGLMRRLINEWFYNFEDLIKSIPLIKT